jgi:hypothetical protein
MTLPAQNQSERGLERRQLRAAYALLGLCLLGTTAMSFLSPDPTLNPGDFKAENFACPPGAKGPFQDTFEFAGVGMFETPYNHCLTGPWYKARRVPVIRRDSPVPHMPG